MKIINIVSILLVFVFVFSLSVSASGEESAQIVINGNTGTVIYEKNADVRLPMASTTKIMTGLILAEQNSLNKYVTVPESALYVEGSSSGLSAGDVLSFEDLLYALMLPSGNDAANVIAYAISGGNTAFAALMNKRAAELGLKNTNFVTPSGLSADGHYTTARDLSELTRVALRNPTFAAVVSTKNAVRDFSGKKHYYKNHNRLLFEYSGAVGVKTGYTKASGRCLVSAAKRNNCLAVAVTLNCPDDWHTHTTLLNMSFEKMQARTFTAPVTEYVNVLGGSKECVKTAYDPLTVGVCKGDDIKSVCLISKFCFAPIKKGDVLGKVNYYCNGNLIDSVPVLAAETVSALNNNTNLFKFVLINLSYLFGSILWA